MDQHISTSNWLKSNTWKRWEQILMYTLVYRLTSHLWSSWLNEIQFWLRTSESQMTCHVHCGVVHVSFNVARDHLSWFFLCACTRGSSSEQDTFAGAIIWESRRLGCPRWNKAGSSWRYTFGENLACRRTRTRSHADSCRTLVHDAGVWSTLHCAVVKRVKNTSERILYWHTRENIANRAISIVIVLTASLSHGHFSTHRTRTNRVSQ